LSAFFAFWFLFTFFSILIASGVNTLTANSPPTLQVWWVGTLLSSILVLLLFYLVFHSSANFNRGMVLLILCTLLITHISLLSTQINLRVT
jgi:protein-S-isoprenylcysteine O-methyltransferase Ste14